MIPEDKIKRTGKTGQAYKTPIVSSMDVPDNEILQHEADFNDDRYGGINLYAHVQTTQGMEKVMIGVTSVQKNSFQKLKLRKGDKFYLTSIQTDNGRTRLYNRVEDQTSVNDENDLNDVVVVPGGINDMDLLIIEYIVDGLGREPEVWSNKVNSMLSGEDTTHIVLKDAIKNIIMEQRYEDDERLATMTKLIKQKRLERGL